MKNEASMVMNEARRVIKKMNLSPGTPVDAVFRGAQTKDDVIQNIHLLLQRAEELKRLYGIPGYTEKTKADLQKIIRFLEETSIQKEAVDLSAAYGVSEEAAYTALYNALLHGWSMLLPKVVVRTNMSRTGFTILSK